MEGKRAVEAGHAVAGVAVRTVSPEPGSEEEKPVVFIQADRKESASRQELQTGAASQWAGQSTVSAV